MMTCPQIFQLIGLGLDALGVLCVGRAFFVSKEHLGEDLALGFSRANLADNLHSEIGKRAPRALNYGMFGTAVLALGFGFHIAGIILQ